MKSNFLWKHVPPSFFNIPLLGGCALVLALLASCGGGQGSATASGNLGNYAALGTLSGAQVDVFNTQDLATVVATTVTNSEGKFGFTVSTTDPNGTDSSVEPMYLIKVSGGMDLDADDDGVLDASPTPNKGVLYGLATGTQINAGIVNVTPITDLIYHLFGVPLHSLSPREIRMELARLATIVLAPIPTDGSTKTGDLNGDGVVNYLDVISFKPHVAVHKASLAIDFVALSQPIDANISAQSVLDKYHAGDSDIGDALKTVYRDLVYQKPFESADSSINVSIGVTTNTGGEVSSDSLSKTITVDDGEKIMTKARDSAAMLTFTAKVTDSDYRFHSWMGCDSVASTVCTVSLNRSSKIGARFELIKPVLQSGVVSFDPVTPQAGVTSVKFEGSNAVTFVTKDTSLAARLTAAQIGAIFTTGNLDHPLIKVSSVTSVATSAGTTTAKFVYTDAKLLETYQKFTAISDTTPFSIDDITAISIADGITADNGQAIGDVLPKASKPKTDFTSSIVPTVPFVQTWNITRSSSQSTAPFICYAHSDSQTVIDALLAAWATNPKQSPFTGTAVNTSICSDVYDGGSMTNAANGTGDVVLATGGNVDSSLTIMASKWTSPEHRYAALAANTGAPKVKISASDKVWLLGHGPAFNLKNGVFLASRKDGKAGMQLLVMKDSRKATTREAYTQAKKDCALLGSVDSCTLVQALEFDRRGLDKAGLPLIGSPISVDFGGKIKNVPWTGTITLSLNIDFNPGLSLDYSFPDEFNFNSNGSLTVNPDIKFKLGVGGTYTAQGTKFWGKKHEKKSPPDDKKGNVEKTLISIDLSKFMSAAGVAMVSSFDISYGVDVSGNVSVTINPGVTSKTDWKVQVRRACYWKNWYTRRCNFNKDFSATNTTTPYFKADISGEFEIKPFTKFSLTLGVREAAEKTARLYVKPYVALNGQAATGMAWTSGDGFCLKQPQASVGISTGFTVGAQLTSEAWPKVVRKVVTFDQDWTFYKYEQSIFEYPSETVNDGSAALAKWNIKTCDANGSVPATPPPTCQSLREEAAKIWPKGSDPYDDRIWWINRKMQPRGQCS